MVGFGAIPLLKATGSILPFRFVELSGAFSCQQANAVGDRILGVTDGSVNGFEATYNAQAGEGVCLQDSRTVQVTAGEDVAVTNPLTSDSAGRAIVGQNGVRCSYIALEGASTGEVFWAFRLGPFISDMPA